MVDYTIAAIPTLYRGRQYRSRLEARWAAFFDLLGWKHEYEPFDLGSWSPDFMLTGRVPVTEPPDPDDEMENGPYGVRPLVALVEVKPIDRFDDGTAEKMVAATVQPRAAGSLLLLLGVAPFVDHGIVFVGWWYYREWFGCPVSWFANTSRPICDPDLLWGHPPFRVHSATCGFFTGITESLGQPDSERPRAYARHTMELWAQATNAVQWRGEGAEP